jgi:glycosyltransferase involved in cell wall biosynthesis
MVAEIRRSRPDLIFYSDNSLGFQLYRWRRRIGVPYRLLFSNGGPCEPPFSRTDAVQQVTPHHMRIALDAGEAAERQFLVPYGIEVPEGDPLADENEIRAIRRRLGFPVNRRIVLSAGRIAAEHKRMDYVVREIAALSEPRPFLAMVGQMDEASPAILALANDLLGPSGFLARTVTYREMAEHYQASDVFVLGSLREGFGRVYIEALIHGLPPIVHDHPVMRFVLQEEARFEDLSRAGTLTAAFKRELERPNDRESRNRRRESVRSRLSWDVLAKNYELMFRAASKVGISS